MTDNNDKKIGSMSLDVVVISGLLL
uniref:Uncharacterized protein n=1 Tax=Rhizophora mucronata TaxID=61149 RepID=A0A2P2PEP9_RHIMU